MAQTFTSTEVTTTTNVFGDNQSQRTNENTLRSNFSGATQPSDPVVGQHWYDTGNNKEWQYNGAAWVPIDTNSTTQVDVSNAKGNLTTLTNYLRVAHNDDGTLKTSPATAIDEFKDNALVITYVSTSGFTVPTDLTSIFTANRKLKVYLSASTAITYVASSSYNSGTNVTTVVTGDAVLNSSVTAVKFSIVQYGEREDTMHTADLSPYALLDSPVLTGTPTAPTATIGTDTTQIATTAFVAAASAANGGANSPGYFSRDIPFYASDKLTIATPNRLWVNIAKKGYILEAQKTFDISADASWDSAATLWQENHDYAVNDVIYPSATKTGYYYRCTTAGKSSAIAPTFPTTLGATYNDGNAVWICQLDFTYSPTTTVRAASTAYTVGAMIRLSTTDGFVYKCTTAGTTAATAPTFPAVAGSTVTDGTAVWTCILGSNRAGKNFYIYACLPATGIVPEIVLSDNSTIPLKYTAGNSRKIGGFHCLCADAGTITGHTLSGYVAGDVLPTSVWDLSHRPKSEPEGMAYIDGLDIWVDIYLSSYTGAYSNTPEDLKLQSVYGANTADGASTEKFHWYKFSQVFSRQKKRMLHHSEFIAASIGSNQSTNIYGSTDVNIAGGHRDTAGRRMISNFGLEDCCGFLYQWGQDDGGGYTGASSVNAYDANDKYVGGQSYNDSFRVLLGGRSSNAAICGSRCSAWSSDPLYLNADCGSRGASEPLRGGI